MPRNFFHVDDPGFWLGRHLVADITVVGVDQAHDDAHLHINGERMHVPMSELRRLIERGILVEGMTSAQMLPPMTTRRR